MEKVRECVLKSSREQTRQAWKIGGDDEGVKTMHQVSGVVVGNPNAMREGLRDEDTRRQRRAAARHENFDWNCSYEVSERHLETNIEVMI